MELTPPVMPAVTVIVPIVTVTVPVASSGNVTLTTATSPRVMLVVFAFTFDANLDTVNLAESLKLDRYLSFSVYVTLML